MPSHQLTALSSLRVSKHLIPAHNLIPNTSLQQKPLLLYHAAFPSSITPAEIESHLASVAVVEPQWRYTMYTRTHFHSTTHEVLCVSRGRARLCFGGEANEGRFEPVVETGDVIVVPAGVGHRLLEDLEGGFEMVGSYPKGRQWDMCYGEEGEEKQVAAIKSVPWFVKDPVYGDQGPALDV
ncbi:hypothetical protein HYQ45_009002 [Verticillium longisporum]|uniref:Cupin type-1 domain-containing protein n=1 Tax=Verticillium longisporum TaxID=100787 RepID=A0A8I2ZJ99_VERLO|nr:hypothetical protein HYQ45_009002 [Verticillium longisporum]PNH45051.1 hypothetical protein VD0004_g2737 [Verticillium dahliae]PNH76345.1 hypothetical protein VD0001_g1163 [Verticillium dahliae]